MTSCFPKMLKTLLVALGTSIACISYSAPLVDADGNIVTNQTPLMEIDMGTGTLGDLKEAVMTTNIVQDIVTNCVVVGQTDWMFSGDVVQGTTYSVNLSEPNYTFTLYSLSPYAQLATVTTNIINPTSISFGVRPILLFSTRQDTVLPIHVAIKFAIFLLANSVI